MPLDWLTLVIGGILIGLIVAAPIGAVNVICIRRTLAFGAANGFMAGLGAAAGDGLFASVAAYGLSRIAGIIFAYETWLQLFGGLFLLGLGVFTFRADPSHLRGRNAKGVEHAGTDDLPHMMASTFFLTITNPATLLAFTAIFAGVGDELQFDQSHARATLLVVSVIAGSGLWWFLLTLLVGLLHGQLDENWLTRLNHITGVLIGLFGLVVLGALIVPL